MVSEHSYSITLSNNRTEKAAIDFVLEQDNTLLNPSRDSHKIILNTLGLPLTFTRAFDLVQVSGYRNHEHDVAPLTPDSITLIELKTTRKKLPDFPKGFFFGATQNELDLADMLGSQYKFCFVCLHQDTPNFQLLTLSELNPLIRTKRTQFQINL